VSATPQKLERPCPDCGERLLVDAIRCACGWGAKRTSARGSERARGPVFDHRCTYKGAVARCAYPVGMFPSGATSGWCVFHRQPLQPGEGSEIVRQSASMPYAEALAKLFAGAKESPSVRATREAMKARQPDAVGDEGSFFDEAASIARGGT
jgi:hypothetical protein